MALLNLETIILYRTVQGMSCPACGGGLEALPVPAGWLRKWMGKKDPPRYRCPDCTRRYRLVSLS